MHKLAEPENSIKVLRDDQSENAVFDFIASEHDMWILNNDTPFAAERTLTCDKDGYDIWVVAVKATFDILAGGDVQIADEQEAVVSVPIHSGEPHLSSLIRESDLDYVKPTTDVLLHGCAYAPNREPCKWVTVEMKVGPLAKSIKVVGDRLWQTSLAGTSFSTPLPFRKIPIIYERAYGGVDPEASNNDWERRNPIGAGCQRWGRRLLNQRAPNLEAPDGGEMPVGFGPVARHWSPRVELAGTFDDRWERTRLPLLPGDFDEMFFQCAPQDQRTPTYLRGGEPVELRNLTKNGLLRFRLPKVVLAFGTLIGGKRLQHRANIHTVTIEPEKPRVVILYHTTLPCQGKKLEIVDTEVTHKPIVSKGGLGHA